MIYGKRIEALFAYVVASLGKARLVVEEGAGEQWAKEEAIAPDWRIVTDDGSSILVDVKNLHRESLDVGARMSIQAGSFEKLTAYARLAGVPLYLAGYWTKLRAWTLLPADVFTREGSRYSVGFETAFKENEMAMLGDYLLGLAAPLVLRCDFDLVKVMRADEQSKEMLLRTREFSASDARKKTYKAGGLKLVFQLGLFANWDTDEPSLSEDGDTVTAEWTLAPPEPTGNDVGFENVGFMSTLLTSQALFDESDGKPRTLSAPMKRSKFTDTVEAARAEGMPVWKGILLPARTASGPNARPSWAQWDR